MHIFSDHIRFIALRCLLLIALRCLMQKVKRHVRFIASRDMGEADEADGSEEEGEDCTNLVRMRLVRGLHAEKPGPRIP